MAKRNKVPNKVALELARLRKKLGIKTILQVKQEALDKAFVAAKGDALLAAMLLGIGKTSMYRHLENNYQRLNCLVLDWAKGR